MKKIIGLFLVCFLVVSCNKDIIKSESELDEFAERMKVRNIEGIIGFDSFNCGKFYVRTHIDGTIDSHIIAIPDNMPEEFKKAGLKIKYSGILEQIDSFVCSPTGGDSPYHLTDFEIIVN